MANTGRHATQNQEKRQQVGGEAAGGAGDLAGVAESGPGGARTWDWQPGVIQTRPPLSFSPLRLPRPPPQRRPRLLPSPSPGAQAGDSAPPHRRGEVGDPQLQRGRSLDRPLPAPPLAPPSLPLSLLLSPPLSFSGLSLPCVFPRRGQGPQRTLGPLLAIPAPR